MKERYITENITLTQDMVHNMSKEDPHANVALKLDITKAYGKVSWVFFCQVFRHM